jgi:peptidoglycan pentaglycine glycine transferase (the first glycine)
VKIEFKELNKEKYEALCLGVDVPLTQNYFYGEWQFANDKKVWRYSIVDGDRVVGFFQVIKYPLSFGKSYLYIPHGPIFLDETKDNLLTEFKNFCTEILIKENCIFLRFDPTWGSGRQVLGVPSSKLSEIFSKSHRVTYDGSFQPKYEWILDLIQSEVDILAGMKKVNRYTVRQAEKAGVSVEIVQNNFLQYLDKFYQLIEGTAERDGFSHQSKDYYTKIFINCERDRNAFMTVARFKGEIMLVNFFVVYGDSVFFLFSGSENENRKLGYTYLAQWEMIKYAKKLGLRNYNFGAVIPESNVYPFYKGWQGFSDFKKRFGGSLLEYNNYYDLVRGKFWYLLYGLSKIKTLILRKFFR